MAHTVEGEKKESKGRAAGPVWKDHNLHVVWFVTLMAVLGSSSVSPAFPEVRQQFGVSVGQVGLLITVFTLPGVFLTFFAGALSDRFGRKRILVPSLLLFGSAGGACALAPNFETLLLLRVLQGVGAASLGALNVTLVGDLFSGRERTTALGYNSSVLNVGTASYPAIGGALAAFGWYYPFALPLLAIPVALLVLFSLRNPEPRNDQELKEKAQSVWERAKNGCVIGLFANTFVVFVILFGALIAYLPSFMSERFGSGSLFIGLVLASTSITAALASTQAGRLAERFSEKVLIRTSYLLYAVSLCLVPLVPSVWLLFVPTVLFGVAQTLNLPGAFSLLNEAAPDENRGAFISLNSTILRLGQTLGPVLMLAATLPFGLGAAYLLATTLAAAMFLVAFALIR
ncbi:MAG TPA: MFS transporter [Rubrobacteraceae bacterium]|nr:MFS transporter [Rubrobacteraceae bacterium]